jgi:tetratricopeptide (TPR) repeat protein
MRWPLSEYILKGVFLGLLLFAALSAPDPWAAGRVGLCLVGGLAAGLAVAAVGKLRQGFRPAGRPLTFLLFLLLESPTLVYAGSILGLAVGAFSLPGTENNQLLLATLGGGAVLGLGLAGLRAVPDPTRRLVLGLVGAAALVGAGIAALDYFYPDLLTEEKRRTLGLFLLLGLPFFYLLTFVGEAEESEVEVAAWCAALALGVWLIRLTPNLPLIGLVVPAVVYFLYSRRVLPGLRVFKHTLRGFSYARLGRYRPALTALRRAVQLDPTNRLARETLWEVHRDLDVNRIAGDPELRGLIDPYLCLDRAAALLLADHPGEAQRAEAAHLLDLVAGQTPALLPQVTYWRAVAATHARQFDQAAAELARLLDPSAWPADDPSRRSVLLPAWQLALTLHPELKRRAGEPELAKPGRRLEAIAAVERALADNPEDAEAWKLKRLLYHELTEADYAAGPVAAFDHAYVQQLGLALVNDPTRWRRGVEYLGLAARGLPQNAPSIATQVAQAYERAGDAEAARRALEEGKRTALAVGPKALPDDERQAYFALVKRLAEDAVARGDLRAAVGDYQLYTQSERSGVETLRLLADLHERLGDALSALRVNEQALLYNAKDRDLLERRDKYYYSVMPDHLRAAPEALKQAIDASYCLTKAGQLLNARDLDYELLDWAQHLIELALALKPESIAGRVMLARAKLRRGERDEAVELLESVRAPKPEKFATTEDQEAWYLACKLLGDLYLRELDRPDLAADCFTAFRTSSKSGADTLYKLGEAYERLGQPQRAAKYYEQVTAYDNHPLAPDARDALRRVKA